MADSVWPAGGVSSENTPMASGSGLVVFVLGGITFPPSMINSDPSFSNAIAAFFSCLLARHFIARFDWDI